MGTLQAEAERKEWEQMKKKHSHSPGDSTSLSALILRNQQSRGRQMDSFFNDLEAKYAGGQNKAATKTAGNTKTFAKKSATKTSNTTKRTVSKSQTKSKAKK